MTKINILVVDDRPEGLMAVEAVLDRPEYNLVKATSGMDALKCLLDDDFAVILLDVQMPVMNGFETASIIKTREKSKDIPIIFMSAISQDEQYVYQGYGVGAVDYLMKPFDPYILRAKVGIFVDLYRKNQMIRIQSQKLHESEVRAYAQALDKLELESLKKYQYLADAIPQIVFRLFPEGSYEYFNKTWFQYTGLTAHESKDHLWTKAIHPDDFGPVEEHFLHHRTAFECEVRIKNSEGVYRWFLLRMGPEFYTDPQVVGSWLGTATDIEDRKRNEEKEKFLAKAGEWMVSSLRSEEIFAHIGDLIVPRLADWCIFSFNGDEGGFKGEISTPLGISSSRLKDPKNMLEIEISFQDKKMGKMILSNSETNRSFGEKDIQLLQELGHRVAMAYENTRLYQLSQDSIEIRNDFLSIASHELNTPITSLKLQLQLAHRTLLLSNGEMIPKSKIQSSISTSIRQVDRLIGLIQVLLDVSRIQSGQFVYDFKPVNVEDVFKEVVERHSEIMDKSYCKLEMGPIPMLSVVWDKTRIEQVVTNLLMNAIKYAPGKIELLINQENDMITVSVQDHGKGIPAEKIKNIFERFERVSTNETVGGLGLGLYIVKQIVEGHAGRIEVESEEGRGSCFKVFLPLNASSVRELPLTSDRTWDSHPLS